MYLVARALYSDADLYILDDPLSALDTKVQMKVFHRALLKELASKTVVLVTHQVHVLNECVDQDRATNVIIMDEGAIVSQGPVGDYVEMFHLSTPNDDGEMDVATSRTLEPGDSESAIHKDFILEETRAKHNVHLKYYWEYWAAAGSGWLLLPFVLYMFATQALHVYTQFFISLWIAKPLKEQQESQWVHYMIALLAGSLICTAFRNGVVLCGAVRAARRLHQMALRSVLMTHLYFFDRTPLGRILNRFSKDIGLMDDILPIAWNDTQGTLLTTVGIVTLVCVTNPLVLAIILPLILYFVHVRTFYLQSSQALKRIEGTTRSPIFTQLSTMLCSLPTIRSYKLQSVVTSDFMASMDLNFSALSTYKFCERWFGIRMDLVSALFQMFAVVSAIIQRAIRDDDSEWINFVGLSLAYMIQLAGLFQWCVRQSAEVQNYMTSSERIMEYVALQREETQTNLKHSPPLIKFGDVKFEGINLRYSPESPLVLNCVTFHLARGEKCGVVGRTGAGKSSLLAALFRLTPYEGGRILLDGYDIAHMPLAVLRSAISIVPQSPTIFSGTVAYNLDPLGHVSEDVLWKVLSQTQLYDCISRLPKKLQAPLGDDGSALSVGERQCLCLARALLRNTCLIVLDEATANVDLTTDQLIQSVIRQECAGVTSLTIAHRIETIIQNIGHGSGGDCTVWIAPGTACYRWYFCVTRMAF